MSRDRYPSGDSAWDKMALRACELHYLQNMTQKEVAHALGASPATVTRLLQFARRCKLVRISIGPAPRASVEEALQERLAGCSAVTTVVVSGHSRTDVGRATARYFEDHARDGCTVVLDGGRTVSEFVASLRVGTFRGLTLVPFTGDPATDGLSADEVMTRMLLTYPTEADWRKLPQQTDSPFLEVVHKAVRGVALAADFVFLGVAPFRSEKDCQAFPWMLHLGHDPRRVMDRSRAVAICGNYGIDEEGRPVSLGKIERKMTWALEFDEVAQLARDGKCRVVILAAGADKLGPLLCAAVKCRLCNTLVLDEELADALLGALDQQAASLPQPGGG